MTQMVRVINIIIIFFFYTCAHAQYYDVGHNTNYFNISNLDSSKYRIIKTVFNVDPSKETKRVFNANGKLMEELVFVNSVLVSGIEYFTHPYFSFLPIPRHFKIEEVKHKFSDYENITRFYLISNRRLLKRDKKWLKYTKIVNLSDFSDISKNHNSARSVEQMLYLVFI